jgi:hypothetical protein
MKVMEPDITEKMIFSDEATFHVSGRVNRSTCVFWGYENPHIVRELQKNSPKVNVWCAITARKVIGPYFFPDNINGENYLAMLEDFLLEELPLNILQGGFFQQDGAPAHYARAVKNLLNENFTGRWIGRGGPVEWPPYSPDLTPCDFWLWGQLKDQVYSAPIRTLDELKERITIAINAIPPAMCQKVINSAFKRFQLCAANNGTQVECLH